MLALFSHQRSELNAYASQIEPALLIADRRRVKRRVGSRPNVFARRDATRRGDNEQPG
nr:2,3-dihydroxybenzoate-AMP ligase enterobactin siderophore [uncultured bacterium]